MTVPDLLFIFPPVVPDGFHWELSNRISPEYFSNSCLMDNGSESEIEEPTSNSSWIRFIYLYANTPRKGENPSLPLHIYWLNNMTNCVL